MWDVDPKNRTRVLVTAVGVAAGLLAAEGAGSIWRDLSPVLSLFGAAVFVAIAMEPLVGRLARRMRRGLATGLVLAGTLIGFAGLAAVGGAVAVSQGRNLLDNLPEIARAVDEQLASIGVNPGLAERTAPGGSIDIWVDRVDDWAVGASGRAFALLGQLLAVLFIAFYLSADLPRILRRTCSFVAPKRQAHLVRAWQLAVEKAGGYLYSRTVLAVVSAGIHSVVFLLVGVDYPVPLGIWVGAVSQAVPVVGAYLGGLLPVLVALGERPGAAIAVFIALVVYQQIENLLLAPKVTANAISVHPLTAFVSVLAGAVLFGWVGALVAVPLAATVSAFADTSLPRHDVALELPGHRRRGRAGQEDVRRGNADDGGRDTGGSASDGDGRGSA